MIRWGAAPTLTLRLVGVRKAAPVTVSVTVRDAEGGGVGVCEGSSFTAPEPGETTEVRMTMPELRLQPGTYTLDVAVANGTILTGRTGVDIDKVTDALALEVTSATEEGTHVGPWWSGFGPVNLGDLTMIGGPVEAGTGGRS